MTAIFRLVPIPPNDVASNAPCLEVTMVECEDPAAFWVYPNVPEGNPDGPLWQLCERHAQAMSKRGHVVGPAD